MKTCIVCDRSFEPAANDDHFANVPYKGTIFTSGGHYGSTVWDPGFREDRLEIIICDPCLEKRKNRVTLLRPRHQPPPAPQRLNWDPNTYD